MGGVEPKFYGYSPDFVEDLEKKFQKIKGFPEATVFKEVLYFPQYHCLYDAEGQRIPLSCYFRQKGRSLNATRSPDLIEVSKGVKKISGTVIYGGYFQIYHYGLFLTESISRLWYLAKNFQHQVLVHGIETRPALLRNYVDFFFESAGLTSNRFISFNTPTLIEEVIVPYPSLSIGCEVFDAHKLVPESIAANCLRERKNYRTSQPLYISRKKLANYKRLIYNEDELEQLLLDRGCAIVSPEELSLKEQIVLINKHETLISTMGSALHNIIFNINDDKNVVCLGYEDFINPNFLMFDALKKINSIYIASLVRDPNCRKKGHFDNQNRFLDMPMTLSALKDINLI